MSVAAITWAFGLDVKPSSLKFVLVALADNADCEGRAFPSLDALCEKTSQDRKTVIANLDRLEELGLLHDTGHRVGRTAQVKVYHLVGFGNGSRHYLYRVTDRATGEFYVGARSCYGDPATDTAYLGSSPWTLAASRAGRPLEKQVLQTFTDRRDADLAEALLIKSVALDPLNRNRSNPKTVPLQSTDSGTAQPSNSTVFPWKQYRFSVETVPKTVHGTVREPSGNQERERAREIPDDETGLRKIKAAYPKGTGRISWILVHRLLGQLIDQGATWDDLEAGARRYAAYCEATGSIGSQFVMNPTKFFGAADSPWAMPWDLPQPRATGSAEPTKRSTAPTPAEIEAARREAIAKNQAQAARLEPKRGVDVQPAKA